MQCEACDQEAADGGVYAVPGLPVSVYFCGDCLRKGLTHPWWCLVWNTAMAGGLEHSQEWWIDTVTQQVLLHDKTMQEFDEAVRAQVDFWEQSNE